MKKKNKILKKIEITHSIQKLKYMLSFEYSLRKGKSKIL